MEKAYLTFDHGASSGRGVLGSFNGESLTVREVHRFANDPVFAFGHYYWDILRLYAEMKTGVGKLKREGVGQIAAMGVDTWGVDFCLLDGYDRLIGNPLYYRDAFTEGEMERAWAVVGREALYRRTGIQFMKFNTAFQLGALLRLYPEMMDRAETMLLMPDALNYMLCGVKSAEYSIASTTQLLDAHTRQWDGELIRTLGLPERLFLPVTMPGRILGETTRVFREETGYAIPVVSVCGHDTGSAVMAVPMQREEACVYISCGTWSLLGVERAEPDTGPQAFAINYTNEGGYNGSIRFLKNIMGLWIYQEVKRENDRRFGAVGYDVLDAEVAAAKPFGAFIDPDADEFFEKGNMNEKIVTYCVQTGQTPPSSRGETLRCVLESLAMKYRYTIERLETLLGYALPVIRVVGGGCKDRLLMRFTAQATGRRVIAGPVEATAIGNLGAQLIATGEADDIWQIREIVARSFETEEYTTTERSAWDDAYDRFRTIIQGGKHDV